MPWGRIDDTFHSHPKVLGIPRPERAAAVGVFWMAISWSNAHTTDGIIPAAVLDELCGTPEIAARLVKAKLWHRCAAKGWRIHDFAVYSKTRAQVVSERSELRRAPEIAREVKARDGDKCRYCGQTVNWLDRRGPLGGTYDHVVPLMAGGEDTVENLVVCCRSCNSRKGGRTPEEAGIVLTQIASRPDLNGSSSDLDRKQVPGRSNKSPSRPVPSRDSLDVAAAGTEGDESARGTWFDPAPRPGVERVGDTLARVVGRRAGSSGSDSR